MDLEDDLNYRTMILLPTFLEKIGLEMRICACERKLISKNLSIG